MAAGASGPGGLNNPPTPIVIKSYTINMEWVGHFSDPLHEVGLGFTHPIPHWSGSVPRPSVPAVTLGSNLGGSASYFYDFKYFTYGITPVTESNQFNPGLGGPTYVWWMVRQAGFTSWSAQSQFMRSTIIGPDDHYTWEIVAECQLFHPIS